MTARRRLSPAQRRAIDNDDGQQAITRTKGNAAGLRVIIGGLVAGGLMFGAAGLVIGAGKAKAYSYDFVADVRIEASRTPAGTSRCCTRDCGRARSWTRDTQGTRWCGPTTPPTR
jgi:hypothetical protein